MLTSGLALKARRRSTAMGFVTLLITLPATVVGLFLWTLHRRGHLSFGPILVICVQQRYLSFYPHGFQVERDFPGRTDISLRSGRVCYRILIESNEPPR
jgi:hypothetical protein